jgi:hypothetical protein
MKNSRFKVGDVVEYSNKRVNLDPKEYLIIGVCKWDTSSWLLKPLVPFEHWALYTETVSTRFPRIDGEFLINGVSRTRVLGVAKSSRNLILPYMPYDPNQQEDLESDI